MALTGQPDGSVAQVARVGDRGEHAESVAPRAGGGGDEELIVDDSLLDALRSLGYDPDGEWLAFAAEVKSGERSTEEFPRINHLHYLSHVVAGVPIVSLSFARESAQPRADDDAGFTIGLPYALEWIIERFLSMEGQNLTKTGSWTWSDDFLASLLDLRRMGGVPPL